MTKTDMVRNHLIENGKITSWEAIQLYRATRLSAIIFNLRHKGMNIITRDRAFKDNDGSTSYYAEYVLEDEQNGV